jgi:hypothetical protein
MTCLIRYAIQRLKERLASGALERVSAVPSSAKTERKLREKGVPCVSSETQPAIAVAIGSADAVDAEGNVIKGGKGALLREKLLRDQATRYIVAVDEATLARLFSPPADVVYPAQAMSADGSVLPLTPPPAALLPYLAWPPGVRDAYGLPSRRPVLAPLSRSPLERHYMHISDPPARSGKASAGRVPDATAWISEALPFLDARRFRRSEKGTVLITQPMIDRL